MFDNAIESKESRALDGGGVRILYRGARGMRIARIPTLPRAVCYN